MHFALEKAIRAWRGEEQRVNVPLVDLKAQYASIEADIRAAIDRVCASQHFILGPEVSSLEAEVAAFCGARFGVGVSSGTDALLAGLMALGIGAGDEVVTTPFSFFATAGVMPGSAPGRCLSISTPGPSISTWARSRPNWAPGQGPSSRSTSTVGVSI